MIKSLRKRVLTRTVSIFLLLTFLQSLVPQQYLFALTTGPHQVEYTSYESPGATDMVNLSTGDFSFSLPVLEVPGPEGSFSLPLTYNAGVGLDQEASWVGLGWSCNPGSITRNVNGFPDDASGEIQDISVKDLTGVSGWEMNALGMANFGWNTESGHYGSLSLLGIVNASWDEDHSSVGIIGVNVGDGVTVDAAQMAMGIFSIVSIGASGIVKAGETVTWSATAAAKSIAVETVVGSAVSAIASAASPGSPPPSTGYWKYSKKEFKAWHPLGSYKVYKIWLDQSRTEDMYGTLYLGNAPLTSYNDDGGSTFDISLTNGGVAQTLNRFIKTPNGANNQGAASDITFETSNTTPYSTFQTPALLAPDNFSVKVAGISGSIAPYRLEVGSVAAPREMTVNHLRFAPVPYLPNDGTSGAYKVPFVYDGASNAYFHHVGGASAVTSPTFYYGISTDVETFLDRKFTYELNDVSLNGNRIKSDIVSSKKIPQHNFVEWLSNDEVMASMTYASKYIDFLSGGPGSAVADTSARARFRHRTHDVNTTSSSSSFNAAAIPFSEPDFYSAITPGGAIVKVKLTIYDSQADWDNGIASDYVTATGTATNITNNSGQYSFALNSPTLTAQNGKIVDISLSLVDGGPVSPWGLGDSKRLGAFCITGVDGTTYHFGLPLYDYSQRTYIKQESDPNRNSEIENPNMFAHTWLLTAITGPDFIDRNSNGLADENDWGYWVKLNYGVYKSEYKWRLPYNDYLRSPDNTTDSYSDGLKQLVYLNSIETRSHVALFKKSVRSDGKDKSSTPIYPLKLDEIVLLTQEHYKKLITPSSSGGFGMTTFTNRIDRTFTNSTLPSQGLAFIEDNAIKRVRFTYSYDLCPSTDNSDAAGGGKLTLTRIGTYGKNDTKLVPDYKFEYGYNPDYDANRWDGFGMYSANGGPYGSTHDVNQTNADQYGSAWSLSKIITPIGSEVLVNYERDDYSTISSQPILQSLNFGNTNYNVYYPGGGGGQNGDTYNKITLSSASGFSVGDFVQINGTINFKCPGSSSWTTNPYSGVYTITAISGNTVTVNGDFLGVSVCGSSGNAILVDYNTATIAKVLTKKGGDLRVGSIVIKDEFGSQNKIRYLYKDQYGASTGCLAKKAEYTNPGLTVSTPLGYPTTPVLYKTVTVLSGKLSDDNDYHSKQVFEFYVPDLQDYTVTPEYTQLNNHFGLGVIDEYQTLAHWKVQDKTNKIGKLKAVSLYNKNNVLYSSSQLVYTDQTTNPIVNNGTNNYQGVYSNGAILFEQVKDINDPLKIYHRATRTTVLKYPYEIKKIVNSKDGFTSETTNLSWDFVSGMVDQKLEKSTLGLYIKTVTKPAYRELSYSEMGSKATNVDNKNMLSQVAATYVYKSDASGANIGLIGAVANTWKKDWSNYRYYNGAGYIDDPNTNIPVWRKSSSYTWRGNYALLRADGTQTFTTSDEFNFASPTSNTTWQFVDETNLYDHYSMPLQIRSHDNIYSAVKLGYDDRIVIARSTNAKFTEIAFTSAEDIVSGAPYFGGEVALGSGTVLYNRKGDFTLAKTGDSNITAPHTGDAAVVVSGTNVKAFIFKPTGLRINQSYRASVWTNSTNGRIYYKLNGGSEQTSAAPTATVKAGKWYRLDFEIAVAGTFTSLEVGVKGLSGKVVFDDFRFQPINANMVCFVYNPLDLEYTANFTNRSYVLDNDNFFTLYEESIDGLVSKVYRETISFGGTDGYRLISEKKNNYRRVNVNQ